jgi:hypothetical protein
MNGLWLPLAEVAAILLAAGAVGFALAHFILPGPARAEGAAWGFAIGLALLAASVPLAFLTHVPLRWMAILLAAVCVAFSLFRRGGARWGSPRLTSAPAVAAGHVSREAGGRQGGVRGGLSNPKSKIQNPKLALVLLLLFTFFGISVYLLRALTEPMWSNDFLAIWGLKGKIIFAAGGVPRRLFTDPSLGFSHPEYPLGLPFLYAALSFLLGRWDDHAMALLFPFLQVATLLALFGWLRRRGAALTLALCAVALLALFEPLYSAFSAGMADVPYSFVALLFGAACADTLDRTDTLAVRRLALASFLAISTKNEGLILAAAGVLLCLLAFRKGRSASLSALAGIAVPAILLLLAGRLWKGSLPLRDFDLAYLGPTLVLELLPRVAEAIHTGFREVILPAWPGLLCVLLLIGAGRHSSAGDRLLALVSICAAAYLLLPSLSVLGPDWLIRNSFARTVSALAPLAAAAIASRAGAFAPASKGFR